MSISARCSSGWAILQSAQRAKGPRITGVQTSLCQWSSVVRSLGSQAEGYAMMTDFQLARGDLYRDPTGVRVGVEDVDIYDYIHFSVIERSDQGKDKTESGQMSQVAFIHRFTKLGKQDC
jgi:hypothetical protein